MWKLHYAVGVAAIVILLVALAVLVIHACGLHGGFGAIRIDFCPRSEGQAEAVEASDARNRQVALEMHLAELQRQLGEQTCDSITGDIVEDAPDISEEDWRNEDISFLEGCWNLESDYRLIHPCKYVSDLGEWVIVQNPAEFRAVEWKMCFDAKGDGTQVSTWDDGPVCPSQVTATFENGKLYLIDEGDIQCGETRKIVQRIAECVHNPAEGTAECVSRRRPPNEHENAKCHALLRNPSFLLRREPGGR